MFEKDAEQLIEESLRLNTTPRETVCKAIEFGFKKGIKTKINTTTISDCPIKDEWHDLRKNPTDLPEGTHCVWTNVGAGCHYDDGWFDDFGRLNDVVAWCEPKFEEEQNE